MGMDKLDQLPDIDCYDYDINGVRNLIMKIYYDAIKDASELERKLSGGKARSWEQYRVNGIEPKFVIHFACSIYLNLEDDLYWQAFLPEIDSSEARDVFVQNHPHVVKLFYEHVLPSLKQGTWYECRDLDALEKNRKYHLEYWRTHKRKPRKNAAKKNKS